mmetsp:Transcript_32440/g.51990  ORF Transcript_32440/g.51990 Transcript_32440/m.51990 type:complete len:276 (-) Transcript_32440:18-845(-)
MSSAPKTKPKKPVLAGGSGAFEQLPAFLRYGPWSPVAYLFLISAIALILYKANDALSNIPSFNATPANDEGDGWWRFGIFLYGIAIIYYIIKSVGMWPLYSFTMMSWTLFTLRYLFSSLHHSDFGISYFYLLSEALRFPALVCNSITITVWWIVLVPAIYLFIRCKGKDKTLARSNSRQFLKWNFSPMLLNIHLLNLPLSAMDHMLYPRMLTSFDLWMGLIVAISYVLFYLFYLDPLGLHFYHVILSPRPHWCFLPYALTLSLLPFFQWIWNHAV